MNKSEAYTALIPEWPIGSKVRVLRKAESFESGWFNNWGSTMNSAIGKEFEIDTLDSGMGFGFKSNRCRFPWFVLELVNLPAAIPSVKGGEVVLYRNILAGTWDEIEPTTGKTVKSHNNNLILVDIRVVNNDLTDTHDNCKFQIIGAVGDANCIRFSEFEYDKISSPRCPAGNLVSAKNLLLTAKGKIYAGEYVLNKFY